MLQRRSSRIRVHSRPELNQRGLGIAEVIASTLIAALAVIGLAYSLGVGRGLIDRYQYARNALGQVSGVLDSLTTLNIPLATPSLVSRDFIVNGAKVGTLTCITEWADDPADGTYPIDPDTNDVKRVVVRAEWDRNGVHDEVALERLAVK